MEPSRRPTRESVVDWQAKMRSAFVGGIGEGDMRDVVRALVARAKSGDMAAIRMVLAYAVGQPRGDDDVRELPPAPMAAAPVRALPRTPDKLAALGDRARRGEALFHPGDADHERAPR